MNDLNSTNWIAMSDSAIERELGGFVRSKRLEQNITQAQLAKRAGISRSTLSLLERGQTVTVLTLIQVLRSLDCLYVLNAFKPGPAIRPMDLVKQETYSRKRASGNQVEESQEPGW